MVLDNNMGTKIVDFGLSKPMVDGPQYSRGSRGTFGYVDPR